MNKDNSFFNQEVKGYFMSFLKRLKHIMKKFFDKRHFQRVKADNLVKIEGVHRLEHLLDISEGGLALGKYLKGIKEGSKIHLTLQINEFEKLNLCAKVVRNNKKKSSFAVAFKNKDKKAEEELEWFVAIREPEKDNAE